MLSSLRQSIFQSCDPTPTSDSGSGGTISASELFTTDGSNAGTLENEKEDGSAHIKNSDTTSSSILKNNASEIDLSTYSKEMSCLQSDDLDAMIVSETDSNGCCQLACLRALRRLCALIHHVLMRPKPKTRHEEEDVLNSRDPSWRHCAEDILNDLTLGQCLSGKLNATINNDRNSILSPSAALESDEERIRHLLSDIQSVGWMGGRVARMTACVNSERPLALLALCTDCYALDAAEGRGASDEIDSSISSANISNAWRWYIQIPPQAKRSRGGESSCSSSTATSNNPTSSNSNSTQSTVCVELSTVQENYTEYRDMCFHYTALILQDSVLGEGMVREGDIKLRRLSTQEFIEAACAQLQRLDEYCRKWTAFQPSNPAEMRVVRKETIPPPNVPVSVRGDATLDAYQAASEAAGKRNPKHSTDTSSTSSHFTPVTCDSMIWEADQFFLAWAFDR